jgi:hypothetical protein
LKHLEQADGIDIEDSTGATLVAAGGIVAREAEYIAEALAGELPGPAL